MTTVGNITFGPRNAGTLYDHPRDVPDTGDDPMIVRWTPSDQTIRRIESGVLKVGSAMPSAHSCGFTYLGSPYSKYKGGPDAAAQIAAKAAAALMRCGEVVYSPIAHGHAVAAYGLPLDWGFWKAQCHPLIDAASKLIVLQMEGWGDSVGLQYEIGEFRRSGKPIKFMPLDEVLLDRRAA